MEPTDSPPIAARPTARATLTPRVVGWLALGGVSLIAGIASYFHAFAVVDASGARPPVSFLVPALADLVILGASADLLAASRAGLGRPRLTMVSLGVGVVVTLLMNVAAADPHEVPKWLVNGWPALAFILALESLAGLVRRGRGGSTPLPAPAASVVSVVPVGCGHGVADTRAERARDAYLHMRDCLDANPSYRGIAPAFDVHHDTVRRLVMAADGEPSEEVPEPELTGASS